LMGEANGFAAGGLLPLNGYCVLLNGCIVF